MKRLLLLLLGTNVLGASVVMAPAYAGDVYIRYTKGGHHDDSHYSVSYSSGYHQASPYKTYYKKKVKHHHAVHHHHKKKHHHSHVSYKHHYPHQSYREYKLRKIMRHGLRSDSYYRRGYWQQHYGYHKKHNHYKKHRHYYKHHH